MTTQRCEGCGKFAAVLYRLWLGYDYPPPHVSYLCSDCHP